ncbi:glycosyltransferase family 39 protein [Muricauda sp. 334s03]|uniref:Glycosyltransferase family 39 protein n=1 Tax=Flagellimonas yonaguniensis TaxID=3031325 RepID=A0ABT5XV79_9FLAO|nr:glycosyltransferase family 39 protein [[Muricauda] yonaguniensis]MDF0715085.1 glycosyltransferase family 39 protein [[Muricauda] yonaguniensis]
MTKKLNTAVLKKLRSLEYQDLDWKTVLFVLVVVSVFIRFPFFFRDYVDRDESTFILMGQSWVNGHLPYTQLWDLKPPITFLYFAIIIKLFGKSFFAIRFFGAVMVAITSLFTYGIATKITSKKIAFWSAIFCVFFQSLFGSLQGVMSEHICTLFFVAGIYIVIYKSQWQWFLLAGLLFGLSIMSKLNMAYPVLTLGIYFLSEGFSKDKLSKSILNLFFMGIGIAITVFLTAFPYYLQDSLYVWWESIFEAPLAYAGGKYHSPVKTLPFVFIVLGLLIVGFVYKIIDFKSRESQLLTVVIIGILLSFMQTGKVNGHYLIQLYPFILIPMGIAFGKLPKLKKSYKPLFIALLLLIPMESYLEYMNIVSNKIKKGSFYNGEGIDVPRYIQDHNLETNTIFFTEYHIGYWVLDETPPTKAATHPSNITRDELFSDLGNPRKTGIEELKYIMEVIQPKTLVARNGKKIFDKKLVDYNSYIDAYLEKHYKLEATVGRGLIYQRLE